MFNRRSASAVLGVMLMTGCSGAVQDMDGADERSAAASEVPTTGGLTPQPSEATAAPVAAPSAAASQPAPTVAPAPAAPVTPQPVAPVTPQPVAAPPVMAAPPPAMPATDSPSAGMGSSNAGATEFDAGAGMMQPDGKTVVFHIADGTGGKDWNSMEQPIRVRRGMTLHIIDDDTTKAHQLHTLGQPCSHGARPIGAGYDCVIRENAALGISTGAYDHNAAGGRGRIYVEVVE